MRTANRFLVKWRSSATGEHVEGFMHEGRAERRLEEVEERAFFEAGAVVDARGAGSSQEEFISRHREFHGRTVA